MRKGVTVIWAFFIGGTTRRGGGLPSNAMQCPPISSYRPKKAKACVPTHLNVGLKVEDLSNCMEWSGMEWVRRLGAGSRPGPWADAVLGHASPIYEESLYMCWT